MPQDDEEDAPHPLLACGHEWDGQEDWADMLVIQKEQIDHLGGLRPAYSTGQFCRACRAETGGERLGSVAEANAWLRAALA